MEKDDLLKHMSPDVLALNPELSGQKVEDDDVAKRNKFNAVKTNVDGITFDSKKESSRYIILKGMEERKLISKLVLQPKFMLQEKFVTPQGQKVRAITYKADFSYFVTDEYGVTTEVVEDIKGGKATQTQEFRLKWKMLLYAYRDKPSYEFKIID